MKSVLQFILKSSVVEVKGIGKVKVLLDYYTYTKILKKTMHLYLDEPRFCKVIILGRNTIINPENAAFFWRLNIPLEIRFFKYVPSVCVWKYLCTMYRKTKNYHKSLLR